jgi:hypothetical protein
VWFRLFDNPDENASGRFGANIDERSTGTHLKRCHRQTNGVLAAIHLHDRNLSLARFYPGGEWPRPPTRFITIAIDLLCVGILIGLKVQLSAKKKPGKRISTAGIVLFWIALLAGLGVLAIRLHDDASWATGHWIQEKIRPLRYR